MASPWTPSGFLRLDDLGDGIRTDGRRMPSAEPMGMAFWMPSKSHPSIIRSIPVIAAGLASLRVFNGIDTLLHLA